MGKVGNAGGQSRSNTFRVCVLEHHPADSRIKIADEDVCQSLTSRMGTGGGNVPILIVYEDDISRSDRRKG